jgi:hypothetical protein
MQNQDANRHYCYAAAPNEAQQRNAPKIAARKGERAQHPEPFARRNARAQ